MAKVPDCKTDVTHCDVGPLVGKVSRSIFDGVIVHDQQRVPVNINPASVPKVKIK